jgi:hypothetical protein
MIKVTVTENCTVLDELEFDDDNIFHHDGALAIVSRDAMKFARGRNLWGRVAHAAFWVSDTDLGALLEAQASKSAIDLVIERLQTGWQPTQVDIELEEIPQFTLTSWTFAVDALAYPDFPDLPPARAENIMGRDSDGRVRYGEVLWIDAGLRWALCQHAFFWLQPVNE